MRSENIIYTNGPGIVKFLMHFMVPVNIHRKICTDIIRYAVGIPV